MTASLGSHVVTIPGFVVTANASVLVVSVYERGEAVATDVLTNTMGWGSQTLTKAAAQYNGNATYAQTDVYYLFNPLPGTNDLICTDGGTATPNAMVMQAYTLNGVNTGILPVGYGSDAGGSTTASSTSVTLGAGTPFYAWAAFSSSYGTGGQNIVGSATSGTVVAALGASSTSQLLGYVANLGPGASTITVSVAGGSQKLSLAVAVFAPTWSGPAAPTLAAVTGEISKVDLSWNDESGLGATSYVLWRQAGSGAWSAIVTNTGGSNVTYTDNNVVPYTTYNYVVQAVSGSGTGAPSATQSATPVGIPPGGPTGLSATGSTNKVNLSWADGSASSPPAMSWAAQSLAAAGVATS